MAVDLMIKSEKISDREAYRKQVYLRLIRNAQREQEMMQSSPVSVIIIKKIIVAE